jgi:hypothetical protein
MRLQYLSGQTLIHKCGIHHETLRKFPGKFLSIPVRLQWACYNLPKSKRTDGQFCVHPPGFDSCSEYISVNKQKKGKTSARPIKIDFTNILISAVYLHSRIRNFLNLAQHVALETTSDNMCGGRGKTWQHGNFTNFEQNDLETKPTFCWLFGGPGIYIRNYINIIHRNNNHY